MALTLVDTKWDVTEMKTVHRWLVWEAAVPLGLAGLRRLLSRPPTSSVIIMSLCKQAQYVADLFTAH